MAKRKQSSQPEIDGYVPHNPSVTFTEVSIPKFLNGRYREYALSTVFDRAIPDVRDGLKPTARKILYVALNRLKGGKTMKIDALAGYVLAESKYEHGIVSLVGNITNLAQDFKQSIPYIAPAGQIGTFYSPYAGASRYVGVKLSSAFDILMSDNDLLPDRYQEGVKIEPQFYLPIVPTILLNVIQGIAVGFSSNIVNRNPIEVCEAVKRGILGEDLSELKLTPYYKGLQGEWRLVNGQFEHHGFMEVVNDTTVHITAIPANQTFDSYENHLNSLIDCEYIESWTDYTKKDKILYVLKFKRSKLAEEIAKDSLYHRLQMYTRVPKENITVIDFDGNVKRYWNVGELVTNFVNWRLQYYELRRQKLIADLERDIKWFEAVSAFIQLVIDEVIVLHKMTTKDVKAILDEHDITHEVLKIAISKLTKDEQKSLADKIKDAKKQLKSLAKANVREWFYNDVDSLQKQLEAMGYELPFVREVTIES